MANGYVQVQPDGSGKKLDTEELTVGGNTVERERMQLTGTAAAAIADVVNADPANSAYGVPVRNIGRKSSSASTPAQVTVGATSATLAAATATRKKITVQNTGITVLKLNLGAVVVTQTAYHIALAACSAADAGDGGAWTDDMWTGEIRIISSAAGGTYVVTELT